jgi:hypothetical protein
MEEQNNILTEIQERNGRALETIAEVVENTYSGRISRVVNAGFALMSEYILYAVALGVFIFIFIMERITPFHLLRQMCDSELINDILNPHEINSFSVTIKVIIGLLAFFIFITAYLLRKNRKYKSNIQESISSLKDIKKELEENNKQLIDIESATAKVLEASVHVANEAKLK